MTSTFASQADLKANNISFHRLSQNCCRPFDVSRAFDAASDIKQEIGRRA